MVTFDRNDFLTAFARVLDNNGDSATGETVNPTGMNFDNHSARTAYVSARLGELLSLSRVKIYDLYAYALLHDSGLTYFNSRLDREIPEQWLFYKKNHSERGEELAAKFPFINPQENVIKYHHACWDGSGPYGVAESEIPLFSQIIHVAHKVAMLYAARLTRKEICEQIEYERGGKFSPELCDCFAKLSLSPGFWVSISDSFINDSTDVTPLSDGCGSFTFEQLLPIARIISEIIDQKSAFTIGYSISIGDKAAEIAKFYKSSEEKIVKLSLAGYLLDCGKLSIPRNISEKPGNLSDEEFETIKAHPFFTRKILSKIKGFEDVTEWASNHHEKINGKGYPLGLKGDELSFESRLIAILNVYQALVQPRPYRMPVTKEAIDKIMLSEVERGALDGEIVKAVLFNFNN